MERVLRARRCASTPPSTRSTAGAWAPRQLLMHPGPGQPRRRALRRGRRLAAGADRSSRSRPGSSCGWPCSTRCSPSARVGEPADPSRSRHDASCCTIRSSAPPAPPADVLDPRRARARPARRHRRARSTCSSATADRRDRRARDARGARRRTRSSTATGRSCSRPSSTRTCTCARPARSTRRTWRPARAPPPPAASAGRSRCRTPTRSWTPRRCCARCATRPLRARRASRSASWPRSPAACDGQELTEMAGAARRGRARLHRRRQARCVGAGMLRRALQYQRLCGGVLALHEEDPALSRRRRHARGRTSARCSASRGSRASASPRWSRATPRSPATKAARCTCSTSAALSSVEAVALAQGARVPRHLRGQPAPPVPDGRGGPHARHEHEDEPAAAHRGRPPGPDRRASLAASSTASPPTTRRTRATRRRCPFEQAPMGTTGLETAFAALYTELVLPGTLDLGAARGAADRRRVAVRPADAADRRRTSRRTSASSTSTPRGSSARTATRAGRRTAASPAASCAGACC